jgi:hypothetical protein
MSSAFGMPREPRFLHFDHADERERCLPYFALNKRLFLSSAVLGAIVVGLLAIGGARAPLNPQQASASAQPRAHTCSRQFPKAQPPHNSWKPATHSLAPPGPTAVRLCRYSERADRLIREVSLTGGETEALMRTLRTLRPLPKSQKHSFTSCPIYVDPIIEAHLAYPHGHSVTVHVQIRCTRVTNGDVGRSWPPKALSRLRRELLRLTR